ncbi:MAG: squalene/phytoene synthase family protein [Chloroflexi bacterium]|nr:squalene/phytoene synthase family protein [Chloroflexota bacterium]
MNNTRLRSGLASSITKAASKQTYYTIRFLADRERIAEAYRAYAYFRWVDDVLDTGAGSGFERSVFINRQMSLLDGCYRGESAPDPAIEEQMLIELIRSDMERNSGLQFYLRNMMAVMVFDAKRRGRLISQNELNEYTRLLASAVTEAMHYFIGHGCYSPHDDARYLAVTAAHITHMLRDTFDDTQAGYYNIPREVLDANHINPQDVQSDVYRAWVQSRVQLARTYFTAGRGYLNRVENLRCRLAGFAYTARFECVLDLIEREEYFLRAAYPERNGLSAMIRTGGSIFPLLFIRHEMQPALEPVPVRQRSSRQ